ncbi:DoxX family protein [Spiribacter halobius]|uniref:DoxX family protein n=1 Tax=Sediminicurvatus halobius TaxID=2182432 RepID=UPI001E61CF4A|nr:DoxX family protein [Spiribacter halobius]UEX77637.1 DoxX family protein [Spiribacter halobius]UEX77927.1 DoxX family protein [Spiribacter halobius]
MVERDLTPYAVTLLRVALGVMFLAHSLMLKLLVFGLAGNAQFFSSLGLPGWLGYVVFAAEVIGGTMLVLGIQARWAALALTPILAGATWAHWDNGWMFGYEGGGWEYPLYLTVLAIAQFLLGDGRFALQPSGGLSRLLQRATPSHRASDRAVSGGESHA